MHSPRLMVLEGSAPPKIDGICGVGKGLSTGILVAIPLALSPEPQAPVSPHTTSLLSPLCARVAANEI